MKKIMFSVSLIVAIIICLPVAYGQIVEDGLFAYWSFDQKDITGDTARDLAGQNDATLNGGPQVVAGKVGEAIQFDGVDDFADLATLTGFGPELGAFTFELCVKTGSTPDWTTLFKILNDGCTTALGIDLNRTAKPSWLLLDGNTHFYMRDEECNALAPEIKAPIYDNQWHHIAWVVEDSENNVTVVYVDGEVQEADLAMEAGPAGFVDFMHPVCIGAGNNRGKIERFCPASVDEFRLYTKALTEAEVAQNYQFVSNPSAVDSSDKLPLLWGQIKQH